MKKAPTLEQLRRHAIARSLFAPTSLPVAIRRLGFVQADPIRSPARAQDLTLRHRVRDYRAGELERRYPRLDIEEDFFVNYGFVPSGIHAILHPREPAVAWNARRRAQADAVLEYVAEHGVVHPRQVDAHFAHGKVRNWFGGSSNATTHLLDDMHYRGLLRVARREGGTRLYALPRRQLAEPASLQVMGTATPPLSDEQRLDRLVDLIVSQYAPLPAAGFSRLLSLLKGGAPQWAGQRAAAWARARSRHAVAVIDSVEWIWPADEQPAARRWQADDQVRLLAPFDPVVWDRSRFELFWGWAYRFEAYTPAARRQIGYYAMPLLWREQVIGWGNLSVKDGGLLAETGYVAGAPPRDAGFRAALALELERMAQFLGLDSVHQPFA